MLRANYCFVEQWLINVLKGHFRPLQKIDIWPEYNLDRRLIGPRLRPKAA